jgi:hypothetical protein
MIYFKKTGPCIGLISCASLKKGLGHEIVLNTWTKMEIGFNKNLNVFRTKELASYELLLIPFPTRLMGKHFGVFQLI